MDVAIFDSGDYLETILELLFTEYFEWCQLVMSAKS